MGIKGVSIGFSTTGIFGKPKAQRTSVGFEARCLGFYFFYWNFDRENKK